MPYDLAYKLEASSMKTGCDGVSAFPSAECYAVSACVSSVDKASLSGSDKGLCCVLFLALSSTAAVIQAIRFHCRITN